VGTAGTEIIADASLVHPELRAKREIEMLSHALVFLSAGIIAALPGFVGIGEIATQLSWIFIVIGILLLVIHFLWEDRPPTL
jgi:uncharacterized membrane protein YtjA (UPF0391 family)